MTYPILFLSTDQNRHNIQAACARDLPGTEMLLFSSFKEWVQHFLAERRINPRVVSVINMADLDDSDRKILEGFLSAEHCDARIILIAHTYEEEFLAHSWQRDPLLHLTLSARGLAAKLETISHSEKGHDHPHR